MSKLIIIYCGKEQLSKSNSTAFAFIEFINRKIGKKRFVLSPDNPFNIIDQFNNDYILSIKHASPQLSALYDAYSVKVYDFKDPVKRFCIDTLGLDSMQCNGTDDDKNSPTHISWEDMFDSIREKHKRPRRGSGGIKPASGFMTAKEVMEVVENDIFRKIDQNCWARSLYSLINAEGYDLSIINSACHPSEITIGMEHGAKSIKLLKGYSGKEGDPISSLPLGEYSFVLDNSKLSQSETNNKIRPKIHTWFEERRIV